MRVGENREHTALYLVLTACAVARLVAAIADHGVIWPDEIYQSVEPAHRLVFGNGLLAWEFQLGARSWFFPAQFAPFLEVGNLLGAESGVALMAFARLLMVAYQVLAAAGAARLAGLIAGPRAGLVAAFVVIALPIQVIFGSRCMSEIASQTWIIWAIYLLAHGDARSARRVGMLLAGAVFIRYQNAAIVLGVAGVYVARGQWRQLGQFALGGSVIALAGGLLDLVTWGRFFHSLIVYVDFNLLQGKASNWGTSPWHFYVRTLWASGGPFVVLVAIGHLGALFARSRLVLEIMALEAMFLGAHMLVPHKELRFVLPIVPLAAVATAIGWTSLIGRFRVHRGVVAGMCVAACASSAVTVAGVTMADLGYGLPHEAGGAHSAWGVDDDMHRALSYVGRERTACGVIVTRWAGSYIYLHRNMPLLNGFSPAAYASSNFLIGEFAGDHGPYRLRARLGSVTILERPGGCAPVPAGYPRPLQ